MKLIRKYILFIILSFFTGMLVKSAGYEEQYHSPYLSLQCFYQNGYVFPTDPFLKGRNAVSDGIDDFQAFSVRISKQTTGMKLWEQLYRYPEWGGGVYIADFYNPQEVGRPIAVYGFMNGPFKRWNKLTLNYSLSLGLAFNWKHYGPTNIYNIAIGAPFTAYIDAGINLEYQIAKKWDAALGFSLSHFSNGALKKPNMGINTGAPMISLKYRFGNARPDFLSQDVPEFKRNNEWHLSVYGGSQNLFVDTLDIAFEEKYEGTSFPVFGLLAVYHRKISYKSKIGFGMSVSYDGSVNAKIAVENHELVENEAPFTDKLQMSIFPSYALVINRFSVIIQPGIYIYRKKFKVQTPIFYQRIGLNYRINKHLTAGLNLRAYHFHVSNYIEWNIGYRFPW